MRYVIRDYYVIATEPGSPVPEVQFRKSSSVGTGLPRIAVCIGFGWEGRHFKAFHASADPSRRMLNLLI